MNSEIATPQIVYQFWDTCKRLLKFATPYRLAIMIGTLATFFCAGLDALLAYLVKPMIDLGFTEKSPFFSIWLPTGIVLIFSCRALCHFCGTYFINNTGRKIVRDLRKKLYQHILGWPQKNIDMKTQGEILSTLTYSIDQVTNVCTQTILTLLKDFSCILGLIIVMLVLSWELSLLCVAFSPVLVLIGYLNTHRIRRASHMVQKSIGHITNQVKETLSGHKIIRLYNTMPEEEQKFTAINNHNFQQENKSIRVRALTESLSHFIISIPLSIAFFWVTRSPDWISSGSFLAIVLAMTRMLQPIRRISQMNSELQQGIVAAQQVFKLMDLPIESLNIPSVRNSLSISGSFTFKSVSFTYHKKKHPALREVSFNIPANSTTAIIGASGSGKSTIIHLLTRFYSPTKGNISLDNKPLSSYDRNALRQNFAVVSQDFELFSATIAENIAYGSPYSALHPKVKAAAIVSQADTFIQKLPNSYETKINQENTQLSGGQKQRIALARAIIRNAQIIIFDEATSSLDQHTEMQIIDEMKDILKNKTIIIIAHRFASIQNVAQLILLNEGKVVAKGNHQELNTNPFYQRLYQNSLDPLPC
jgi:ATP-binding cassette, subfamily B, bacterial MsbA